MTELQYADRPPQGYVLLPNNALAKQWDKAFLQKEGAWVSVDPGMNIIGACSHDLWHQGVLALARRAGLR